MAGWYELSSNDKGQFSFVLKAGNGEVILRSEQYNTKASAENGVKSLLQPVECGAPANCHLAGPPGHAGDRAWALSGG